jgi:hypothetical protein
MEGLAKAYYEAQQDGTGSHHRTTAPQPPLTSTTAKPATGWYVVQPREIATGALVCIGCGAADEADGPRGALGKCYGCNVVSFCRQCRYSTAKLGHSVVGAYGYGRACVTARHAAQADIFLTSEDRLIGRIRHGVNQDRVAEVDQHVSAWKKGSPFADVDAVFVLSFSIIMLNTNLHSVSDLKIFSLCHLGFHPIAAWCWGACRLCLTLVVPLQL